MAHRYPLNKPVAVVFALFHVGAVAALFFFTWSNLGLAFCVWVVGGLSITTFYHRYLTHKGFETPLWFEYVMATSAQLPLQGDPRKWIGLHRRHHKHTEEPEEDPHTPRDGGWWSHMDWMSHPNPKYLNRAELHKWTPDLAEKKRRYYTWLEDYFWLPITLWGVGCLMVHGLQGVLWGVAVPTVIGWHATWLVNSGTHMWGYRNYQTDDDSRNNWWIAIITFGEGWHNNHHFSPRSAHHGHKWWEIDMTYYVIKILELVRLARNIKLT